MLRPYFQPTTGNARTPCWLPPSGVCLPSSLSSRPRPSTPGSARRRGARPSSSLCASGCTESASASPEPCAARSCPSPDRRSAPTTTSCRAPSGCSETSRPFDCHTADQRVLGAERRIFCGSLRGLLGTLRAILRPRLLALVHARGVQCAADDVIPHAGQVLHAAAADHHDRVLLQVMPFTGDVCRHFEPIRQPYARHFAQCRVRLFRRGRVDARAHPPLLRVTTQMRRLFFLLHVAAAVPDELIDGRQIPLSQMNPKRLLQSPRN